jgi:hypothetical protein
VLQRAGEACQEELEELQQAEAGGGRAGGGAGLARRDGHRAKREREGEGEGEGDVVPKGARARARGGADMWGCGSRVRGATSAQPTATSEDLIASNKELRASKASKEERGVSREAVRALGRRGCASRMVRRMVRQRLSGAGRAACY